MANIIEKPKIHRIRHRFDTAENWKKSKVQLLPGEIAFDEHGNFKVGLNDEYGRDNSWGGLPFAGKAKFTSGYSHERPTIETDKSYSPGDMFKDLETNKWYFLTGFDKYGEYVWEELTFGTHDLDTVVSSFEEQLSEKIGKEELESLATKEELISIGEMAEGVSEKVDTLEETVIDILGQLENIPSQDEILEELASKATKEELDNYLTKVEHQEFVDYYHTDVENKLKTLYNKHTEDLSALEASINTSLEEKVDKTQLEEVNKVISQKVDATSLFDESGNIRSSLLPGSVDDIVEGVFLADGNFMPLDSSAQIGVGGKLYLDVNTKELYRWSGSQYVAISSGSNLVLGTTTGTAFEGSAGEELRQKVSSVEESLTELSSNIDSVKTTVDDHSKSIVNLDVAVDSNTTKISELQATSKTQATTLSNHEKRISTLETKVAEHDDSLFALQEEASKISSFDTKIKNVENKVNNLTTEVSTINITVSSQVDALVQQSNKIASLEGDLKLQKESIDKLSSDSEAIEEKLESVEDIVDEQKVLVSVMNDALTEQKSKVDNLSSTVQGYSDRIVALEQTNKTQNDRLGGIESKVVEQIESIATIKTTVEYQTEKIKEIETKVEDSSSVEEALTNIFDESGFIKSSLLPGYVDDVIEGVLTDGNFIPLDSKAEVRVSGKLYVDISTKEVYRWSGSQYVMVSEGSKLVLGTTTGTAYEGSAGKELERQVDSLERKVDAILSVETPDGTVTLGAMAFKDSVADEDITSVNVSKLVVDDVLELWCGDSSD